MPLCSINKIIKTTLVTTVIFYSKSNICLYKILYCSTLKYHHHERVNKKEDKQILTFFLKISIFYNCVYCNSNLMSVWPCIVDDMKRVKPTRCYTMVLSNLINCSTCFGHYYAHRQELATIQTGPACGTSPWLWQVAGLVHSCRLEECETSL